MASIRTPDSIGLISRTSATVITLGPSRLSVGGQQYLNASNLTMTTSVSGAGGIDTGTISTSNNGYYLYAVISNGALALVCSLRNSSLGPSGFTAWKYLTTFNVNSSGIFEVPARQTTTVLTSGTSLTYTTPNAAVYLKVRMVGGGGGGGGGGVSGMGIGGAGGATTFSYNSVSANGGNGGGQGIASYAGGYGGQGGTVTNAPSNSISMTGNGGISVTQDTSASYATPCGGTGGAGVFGGAGSGSSALGSQGSIAGATNSGAGGGGGGISGAVANALGGGGGGAGGYCEFLVPSPSASYTYTIGSAGTAGTGGTSGYAGAVGGTGLIIVDEFY